MDPVVKQTAPILLVGVKSPLPPRAAAPSSRPEAIAALWRDLLGKVPQLSQRIGEARFSVIEHDVLETGTPAIMYAMVVVSSYDDLPDWCERFTVEPGLYAKFIHHGPPRELGRTVAGIHSAWSGKIPGLFSIDREIMHFPQYYEPRDPNGQFEYWVPLPESDIDR